MRRSVSFEMGFALGYESESASQTADGSSICVHRVAEEVVGWVSGLDVSRVFPETV